MEIKERIFIHIPKTGGTTLNTAINKTNWQTKPDFHYRHILYDTKKSNSGDIFLEKNRELYSSYDIFSILRHPVDRLISEYFFIRDRKEFMGLIRRQPKNITEYAQNKQTQNYMTSFFLGGRMFPTKETTQNDLDKVIKAIDQLPIWVGIFEEYEKSMDYLAKQMNIKWPKNIEVKRVTLNRPKLSEVTEELKQVIIDSNSIDMQLYNHCKDILDSAQIKSAKVKFQKDKYGYIIKYTQRFILFELFMADKKLISRNNIFFRELNLHLHSLIPWGEGKRYVQTWNKNVTNAINKQIPSLELPKINPDVHQADPLEYTKILAEFLEAKTKEHPQLLKMVLKFDVNDAYLEPKEKKSLLSKLFKS